METIKLDHIVEIENYRSEYPADHITALAESMKIDGFKVEYAIIVTPLNAEHRTDHGKMYGIVAGHCRTRAARLAKIAEIPCHITEKFSKLDQLAENLNRRNTSPIDDARGFKAALDDGESMKDLCRAIGKTEQYVQRRLWLLDLVPEAQQLIAHDHLGITAAEIMHELDSNRQRIALRAYNEGKAASMETFKALCNKLLEQQKTCNLFDLNLFNGKPIEEIMTVLKVERRKSAVELALEAQLMAEIKARKADREFAKQRVAELLKTIQKLTELQKVG